jgi:hypothetical protein
VNIVQTGHLIQVGQPLPIIKWVRTLNGADGKSKYGKGKKKGKAKKSTVGQAVQ